MIQCRYMSSLAETGFGNYSSVAKMGRFWFQWRSLSPIPLFILLVVLPPDFVPSVSQALFAGLVIVLAESLRIWAVGHAGSATRTRGDSVPVLCTAGPYRFVRNPLYIANAAMYTACGILFGFSGLSILILFYTAIQYIFIVAFEEETLTREFGEAYTQYCEKVNRWMPSFTPSCAASDHQFDLGRGLRSERSTFYSMSLMAGLFLIKKFLL